MPDPGSSLALLADRLPAAVAFGLAAGALLWLLGLYRKRGALPTAGMVALALVAAGWPAAILLSVQATACGAVGRVVESRGALRARPGLRDALALGIMPSAAFWGTLLLRYPAYWLALAGSAVCAGTAAWTCWMISSRSTGRRISLPTLRPAGDDRGVTGNALLLAGALAFALAALSLQLGLVGPGEPAALVFGAAVGLVAATTPAAGAPRSRRIWLAVLTGGLAGTALVAALP